MAGGNEEVVDKKAERQAKKDAKKAAKAAKKNAKAQADMEMEEESIGSKIAVFFVSIIIIAIWLTIIALLIRWDVGGFGSTVLGPLLKDVPHADRILPESVTATETTEDPAYAFDDMEAAVARIKALEVQLAEAQNASNSSAQYISELESMAAELAQYKQDEANFEAIREKFYEEVVFSDAAPDIENYKAFYESIDPANAEMIYRQVVDQTVKNDKIKEYINTYSSMKPKEAAAMFDTMTNNLNLVAEILSGMDAQSRANILGKMNADTAAKVTAIMKPKTQ